MFDVRHKDALSVNNDCSYKTIQATARDLSQAAPTDLFVCHINIVSLIKNMEKLEEFLQNFSRKIDIICLSETRLKDAKLLSANIPGYHMYYCNSKTMAGGSAIYVNCSINSQQLTYKICDENCEDTWVQICQNNHKLVIGSIYRHPSGSIVNFENALVNILKNFQNQDNYLLMGDFNINWEKKKSCHVIKSYFDHLLTFGCKQIIDKPTRVTINTQTVIDHIYANFVSNSDVSSSIINP